NFTVFVDHATRPPGRRWHHQRQIPTILLSVCIGCSTARYGLVYLLLYRNRANLCAVALAAVFLCRDEMSDELLLGVHRSSIAFLEAVRRAVGASQLAQFANVAYLQESRDIGRGAEACDELCRRCHGLPSRICRSAAR